MEVMIGAASLFAAVGMITWNVGALFVTGKAAKARSDTAASEDSVAIEMVTFDWTALAKTNTSVWTRPRSDTMIWDNDVEL